MTNLFTSVLSAVAPELEAALPLVGGPFGAVGAMAVKALSDVVIPGDPSPTVDKIMSALQLATPEQLATLQKANDDFKLRTQQLNVDVLKIRADQATAEANADAADRANARQSFGILRFIPQLVLSTVFVAGYFALVYELVHSLLTGDIKLKQVNPVVLSLVSTLAGIMTAAVTQILNFWFGSSHGSQKKDDALAAAAAGS